MPIPTLIIDDEPPARALLRELLSAHPTLELRGEAGDGPEAVAAILRLRPALVFLDVQMPGLDGFGVLREVAADHLPQVVFVSAFDRYALQAFEVHALHYLLKPIDERGLARAVHRAQARFEDHDECVRLRALLGAAGPSARRLPLREGERVILQDVNEVEYFEADGKYVHAHVAGQPPRSLRISMHELAADLGDRSFLRINRSVIVNLAQIREIQPWFRGEWVLITKGGRQLTTTRRFRAGIDALLGR